MLGFIVSVSGSWSAVSALGSRSCSLLGPSWGCGLGSEGLSLLGSGTFSFVSFSGLSFLLVCDLGLPSGEWNSSSVSASVAPLSEVSGSSSEFDVSPCKASGLAKIPVNRGSKNGFLFNAASLWNMLPQSLRDLASNEEFADAASVKRIQGRFTIVSYKDEKQIQCQVRQKEMHARNFKRQIKKWICDNIPEE